MDALAQTYMEITIAIKIVEANALEKSKRIQFDNNYR